MKIIICPLITQKRLDPYICEGTRCAWWVGGADGKCAVAVIAHAEDERLNARQENELILEEK